MFHQMVEAAHDGILAVDAEERIRYINPSMLRMLGYEAHELIGRSCYVILPPSDAEVAKQRFEDRRQGHSGRREFQINRKDGSRLWAMVDSAPVTNPDGVFEGIVANVTDITEYKRLEAELRQARAQLEGDLAQRSQFLESVVENIPDMIFVKDAKDLRFVGFNRAGEELLGYDRADLIGKSDRDLFPAEEAAAFVAADRAVLEGGTVVDIPEETIHTRHHGVRILHTKKLPLLDADGVPRFLLGISEDITARKLGEAERRQRLAAEAARERFEFLSESTKLLTATLDPERALRALAERAAVATGGIALTARGHGDGLRVSSVAGYDPAVTGGAEAGLLGRTIEIGAVRGLAEALRENRTSVFSDTTAFETRDGWRALLGLGDVPDGVLLDGPRTMLGAPLVSGDTIVGAFALIAPADVDESRLALARALVERGALALHNALLHEETRQAVQVREDFLAHAAHELRTPVSALKLQIELIMRLARSERLTPDRLEQVAPQVEGALGRFSRLVSTMLDLTRLDAGLAVIARGNADLVVIARDAVGLLTSELAASGCAVTVQADGPVVADVDPERIGQVVVNLLTNATRYARGSAVELTVSATAERGRIVVRDHGPGIAPEDLPKLFRRFGRLSSQSKGRGLGLGLYISRLYVEAHDGTIAVESQRGEGATFIVELPLRAPPRPAPAA